MQHAFFVDFFVRQQGKLPETASCSRSLFFTTAHFHLACDWWPLAFLILAPPLQNFHVVLSTRNVSFFYLPLKISVALFLVELRWPAAYFLFFSVFLLLFIPNLWTWQLIRQNGYRNNFRFPFSSLLQDAGGYAISRQNNLELQLGCHTFWVSYFTWVCLWCGRTGVHVGVRSRDYQISLDGHTPSF